MSKKKLTIPYLVIIITTTVYSFSSMSTGFYMMGIKALPWFIISGLFYFVPYALILSQYTKKYADRSGTIYDWLKDSLSPKTAFITACLWYCSYFTWLISLFMKLIIPFSILLFGHDITSQATWQGLPTQALIAIFAIVALFGMTFLISRGFAAILSFLKVSSFAMIALLVLSLTSNTILVSHHLSEFGTNLHKSFLAASFFEGTQNNFASQLPFFIFAITAFGGLDTIASLSDRTKDSKKRFPKALLYSAGIIILLYIGGIILWSGANDLTVLRQTDQMHLGNLMYGLMGSLAKSVGATLHLSANGTQVLYQVYIRYTAFTLLAAYLGLLSSITFGPLKSLVLGTPKAIWPKKWTRLNAQHMPIRALWIQAFVVALCILALSLNSTVVANLFNQLTYMTNVSRALPYFVVAMSYPFFLRKKIVSKDQLLVTNPRLNLFLALSVCACILFAIAFQVYQPLTTGSYRDALTLTAGPLFFAALSALWYRRFEQKNQVA